MKGEGMGATAAASRIADCEDELALLGNIDDCHRRIAARSRDPALLYEVAEAQREVEKLRRRTMDRRQDLARDWKQKSEPTPEIRSRPAG